MRPLSPTTLYAAIIEGEEAIDYFDTGVAAEAKALDGIVVSTDRFFDKLAGSEGSVRNLLSTACLWGRSLQLVKRSNLLNSQV